MSCLWVRCRFTSRTDLTGHHHLICVANCFLLVHGLACLESQDDAISNSHIEKLGVTGLGCCTGAGRSHPHGIDFSV